MLSYLSEASPPVSPLLLPSLEASSEAAVPLSGTTVLVISASGRGDDRVCRYVRGVGGRGGREDAERLL